MTDALADRADRHLTRLVDVECSGVEELETLNYDIGAVRTVRDLIRNGGLTSAGRVLAERVVRAAEEWYESKTGETVAER